MKYIIISLFLTAVLHGQKLTTTQQFANGDQITSTKLNNIIDDASFGADAVVGSTLAVVGGQLKVNEITASEIATDAVTTDKVLDENITLPKLGADVIAAIDTPTAAGFGQAGTAPVFAARAWARIDGNTSNAAFTYVVTSNVVTVTMTNTFAVGHRVQLTFTTGTATSQVVTVATATASSFTAALTNGNTSGNGTVAVATIRAGGNVANANLTSTTGLYLVNLTEAMTDTNAAVFTTALTVSLDGGEVISDNCVRTRFRDSGNAAQNPDEFSVLVFR